MVSLIQNSDDRKLKTVDVKIDLHNIQDIISGLNILVGKKEDEMNRFNGGDARDKEEYQRYKKLLEEMQQTKILFK